MSSLFWPTVAQMARLEPFFPRAKASHVSMTVAC
jgi:hypothetical protein